MKTNELTGAALDWAVSVAEGDKVFRPRLGRPNDWDKEAYLKDGSDDRWCVRVQNPTLAYFVDWQYRPSSSWMEGGPIIEREEIGIKRNAPCSAGREWEASPSITAKGAGGKYGYGPTPLIAAMRCFVASKLGDEVEVPKELIK